MTLQLDRGQLAQILAHCRQEAPNEACGLLSGRDGRVTRVWPTRNSLASPTEYLIEPEEQLAVMRAIWEAGEQLVGIFHSHPKTQAYPSPRDIAQAYYPEAAYVIVSLSPVEEIGVFRIRKGQVTVDRISTPDEERTEQGGVEQQ